MVNATEAATFQGTPMSADLKAGVGNISVNQTVTFRKYKRLILPLDGYLFWVRASLVRPGAVFNTSPLNTDAFNSKPQATQAPVTDVPDLVIRGSLHYSTDTRQEESENYAANHVVFTAEAEVQDLNTVAPDELYIAECEGVKFAFSSRGSFYRQADLFHYTGFAVYADMATQVVDDVTQFNSRQLIVSNSLPIWLAFARQRPLYGFGPNVQLYPSFLTPPNLEPPYGAIHIPPEMTSAIGGAPRLSPRLSSTLLNQDTVRVTLYGLNNDGAWDFLQAVLQYSLDYDLIGIMNQPTIRDDKRTQSELGTLAMKKLLEFQVSYYQERARDLARQLIKEAVVDYDFV